MSAPEDARPPAASGRIVRVLGFALLAALALLALASEVSAIRDRAAPGGVGSPEAGDAVAIDVAPAFADAAARLVAIERECAALAETALARTDGVSDPAILFTILENLRLPASAGVEVADRDGRILAWAGVSADLRAAETGLEAGDCAVVVTTPSSRRFAVRRTRTVTRPGIPARALCHLPFEVSYPLRNRFFASWSVADEVRAAHRVGAVVVEPPGPPDEPERDASGGRVASAFGGDLARVRVTPLSRRAWDEAVDRDLAGRRAWFLVVGALAAAALAAWETRRLASQRPAAAALARAGLVAALRAVLALVPAGSILPGLPATDPQRYAHGLPLAFAASPADLFLTCAAALGVAACLRRAAQAAPLRPRSVLPGVLALAAAAAAARRALGGLVADAVANSRVEFFADVTVLPQPASAALFGALVAAGLAAALAADAAWTWCAPAVPPRRGVLALLALAAGALAVPSGPDGPGDTTALAIAGGAAFALALATLLFDAGTAVRAGLVPVLVALAVFVPLEHSLAASLRGLVREQAEERMRSTDATARLLVERTLENLTSSAELADALRRRTIPRDLQLRLWASSPLASRSGGSAIEIEPRDTETRRVRFGVNLPPVTWLPPPQRLDTISEQPLRGRGPGSDGRWMVGARRILVDGVWAANAWVTLEVRGPSNPGLPELEILGPAAESDILRAPPLAVSRYGADGRLLVLETNDADRPGGAVLPPEVRADATGPDGVAWRITTLPEKELAVAVLPDMQGDTAMGYQAFSFETGGARRLALRAARALLFGALVGGAAVLLTARRWTRGARMRLAYRLVVSYVVVSGLPLLLLGLANRGLAQERADETASRELQQAISLLRQEVEAPGIGEPTPLPLRLLEYADADREENLRAMAYRVGHHANVFHGTDLLASSDQGLFDTDLLPRRLPGPVTREILVLQRPFTRLQAQVGGETFDVGWAPVRTTAGEVVGALSVPLLNQRRLREADVANGMTAILSLYLASLVAAIAVGTWLASRLTRPLRDLTVATQRVAAGDLSRPVPEAGPGELGEVVGAFNRMMRDLAESRERLVRAEKEAAWRDMARQVAHEVKNPLTPMRLAAEHLRRAWRDQVPNFDEVLQRGVDLIVRQTESLQRIATSFSDFARLPGRRREPTDVAEILRRVADLYRSTPQLTVAAEFSEGLPKLLADPDELQRVLVNLAKNAVESMEGRPGRLAMRLRRDGDHLVLEVEDDGPGIAEDVLARLFEPYFSTKTSGTGLGLAICKRAVEDLGGTIAVRSARGQGTTVTLRLPVAATGTAVP